MFAVIQTGGKQYKVAPGDVIFVEKLSAKQDDTVVFDALMFSGDDGVKVGTPIVSGVEVQGKVQAHVKGEKILVYKYKAKKNYRRKAGHRQPYTRVEITAVTGV